MSTSQAVTKVSQLKVIRRPRGVAPAGSTSVQILLGVALGVAAALIAVHVLGVLQRGPTIIEQLASAAHIILEDIRFYALIGGGIVLLGLATWLVPQCRVDSVYTVKLRSWVVFQKISATMRWPVIAGTTFLVLCACMLFFNAAGWTVTLPTHPASTATAAKR